MASKTACLVLLAAANTASAEVQWTVSSEYISYLQNNVCETGECLGWCAEGVIDTEGNCESCKDECAISMCTEACVDSNGSSESPRADCSEICCEATTPGGDCTYVATNAPTEAPVIDDDTGIFTADDDTADDDTVVADDGETGDGSETGDEGYAPDCRCIRSEDFPAWNVLTEGNYVQDWNDIEGSAAIGGNFVVQGFSVGNSLEDNHYETHGDGLRVGGDIDWQTGGSVFHGTTSYGGSVDSQWVDFADGISQSDTVDAAIDADFAICAETSRKLAYNSWYYDTQEGDLEGSTAAIEAVVDGGSSTLTFDNTAAAADGTCTEQHTHTGAHYYTVKASELQSANRINVNHRHTTNDDGSLETDSLMVINVVDDIGEGSISISDFQFFINDSNNGNDAIRDLSNSQTVWNFNAFTSVSISGVSWTGAILAPNADVTYNNGNYEGNLCAKSFSGSSGEGHHHPPQIPECVEECLCETPAPTPAPGCPCLDNDSFPWWNAVVSGDVYITGDIEGNLAAGGSVTVGGNSGTGFGVKLGRFNDINSESGGCCEADADSNECGYAAASNEEWYVGSEATTLMIDGELTWGIGGSGTVYGGDVWASACSGITGQVDIQENSSCNDADTNEATVELFVDDITETSELLWTEGAKTYEGWSGPVEVMLQDRGNAGDTLYFETEGLAPQPMGVYFFSVAASALQNAEGLVVDRASGDEFIVINVEDDVDGTLELQNFQIWDNSDATLSDEWTSEDECNIHSSEYENLNRQTIWNFESSITDISISDIAWRGSLVAPGAALHSKSNQILGSVYVASLDCDGEEGNTDQCGELHYWPPHVDLECVCPDSYVAPTPAPEKSCIEQCFDAEFGDDSSAFLGSCSTYEHFISEGCSHCSDSAMTDYVDSCLVDGCELAECGVEEEDCVVEEVEVVEIEVEVVCEFEEEITVEEEEVIVETFVSACAEEAGIPEGHMEASINFRRRLNDGGSSATISMTVADDQGSSQLSRACTAGAEAGANAVGATSFSVSDNSDSCTTTDGGHSCATTTSVYRVSNGFSADAEGTNNNSGGSSASSGGSAGATAGIAVGCIAGTAMVVGLFMHMKQQQKGAPNASGLEMKSDGTVTRV